MYVSAFSSGVFSDISIIEAKEKIEKCKKNLGWNKATQSMRCRKLDHENWMIETIIFRNTH